MLTGLICPNVRLIEVRHCWTGIPAAR